MAFQRDSGAPRAIHLAKKASTVFAVGDLVYADGSGAVQPADATSGNHLGIINQVIAATDDDYTSNKKVLLDQINDNDIFRVDVGAGTLTTAMIGNYYDLADAASIDVGNQSKNVVLVVGFVSTTVALVKINATASNVNVATS